MVGQALVDAFNRAAEGKEREEKVEAAPQAKILNDGRTSDFAVNIGDPFSKHDMTTVFQYVGPRSITQRHNVRLFCVIAIIVGLLFVDDYESFKLSCWCVGSLCLTIQTATYLLVSFWIKYNMTEYAHPRATAALLTECRDQARWDQSHCPERFISASPWRFFLSWVDWWAQNAAIDFGWCSALRTGRHYILYRYHVAETEQDVRPTNMRANQSVSDRVEVIYSLVENYFSNLRTTLIWLPETASSAAVRLTGLPMSERFETSKQLIGRVTNLMVDSTLYYDAYNGSARMAVFMAAYSDVQEGVCRRMQGDLNYQGAPGPWRMVSAIAPVILFPCLALAVTPLASVCFRVSTRVLGGLFSRCISALV